MIKMASLKLALLLFSGLQCSALTSGVDTNGLPKGSPSSQIPAGDTCQDCTQIVELLVDILSDADIQRTIMDSLETLCDHLPEPSGISKICREQMEKMFPMAVTFITASVKPNEVCNFLGLCHLRDAQKTLLLGEIREGFQAFKTREGLQAFNAQEELPTAQCRYCLILIKMLESLLPREKAEGTVIQLLGEVCGVLPYSYKDECEALIDKFGKTLLDALTRFATPQVLCGLVRLCKEKAGPVTGEGFQDPCGVAGFRCRDVWTAIKCGTLPYCQRFVWKSPANKTF